MMSAELEFLTGCVETVDALVLVEQCAVPDGVIVDQAVFNRCECGAVRQ